MGYSNTLLFIEDQIKRTNVLRYYKDFCSHSFLDADQIREIQNIKLKKLIAHAYDNIDWYRNIMDKERLKPSDINSIDDLSLLPLLSREDIRDNAQSLKWANYQGKITSNSSSGTTGIPIRYFNDKQSISAGIAAGYALNRLSNWKPGMRNVHIWGNPMSIQNWDNLSSRIKQLLFSKKNIPATNVSDPAQITSVIRRIKQHKPIVLDGYSNSIFDIARFCEKNKERLHSVKLVVTTAENLEPFQKKLIEEIIAPVADLYGCGEINGIASNPANDDKYYILDSHVFVESIAKEDQVLNDAIVTDLDNYFMPLIRYNVGDMIDDVQPGSNDNILPFSYFRNIYGRSSAHILLPNGKKLFPISLFGGTLFRENENIIRHKTIWDGKKITVVFEIEKDFDITHMARNIEKQLEPYNINCEVLKTNCIPPNSSGKYQFFESIL